MNYLQKYKGKSTRHTCPVCKAKQSFTLYLDGNTHEPFHHTVGKCNREIKCGYHYTPKQYFMDNPNFDDAWYAKSNMVNFKKYVNPYCLNSFIDFHYLVKSLSVESNLISFLRNYFSENQIEKIFRNYFLGATKNKEVIFWQIDSTGKVRTGKIMQYNPNTGKRLKHRSGAIDWVHNKLKKSGALLEDFNLQQCFFGEHLLTLYPDKSVAIVESEKSALIASALIPNTIWLAAGNINGLSVEKCKVLKNRNVMLYPDLGAFEKWSLKAEELKELCNCKIIVSTLLEDEATETDRFDGLDIADFMFEEQK